MLRFAPSPTGFLHIGNARVAILNYFYAKKNNIDFFLRIDDTDKERSEEKYIKAICEDLEWLGIRFDKIIKQSERISKYKDAFDFLKKKNLIYPCFETKEELSLKRKILLKQGKTPIYDRGALKLKKADISSLINSGKLPHWRLKLDDESINWNDKVHGEIKFDNLSVSDPVVFRSDEMPLFTITSVVDDIEFNVSNIFRGDDHITNTAAQIKLFKYLDSNIPSFGHFPLLRTKTGSGLSKRFNSFSLRELRKNKFLPIIIINYLNKIGSSASIENISKESDLIQEYNLKSFSKNSVLFDEDDLKRLNSKYLKSLTLDELKKNYEVSYDETFWNIIRKNSDNLDEVDDWFKILRQNHDSKLKIDPKLLEVIEINLPATIDLNTWENWTKKILENFKIKPRDLYMSIRVLLTGKKYGPSMNELLTLFQRDEILKRLKNNCE